MVVEGVLLLCSYITLLFSFELLVSFHYRLAITIHITFQSITSNSQQIYFLRGFRVAISEVRSYFCSHYIE